MTFRIVSADPSLVEHSLGAKIDLPAVAVVGIDGDKIVGAGGLAWGDGVAYIWFKMTSKNPAYAVAIVRATRKMLRRAIQLGATEVLTTRDPNEPASQKLLALLGFEMLGLDEQGAEVWVWRPTHHG